MKITESKDTSEIVFVWTLILQLKKENVRNLKWFAQITQLKTVELGADSVLKLQCSWALLCTLQMFSCLWAEGQTTVVFAFNSGSLVSSSPWCSPIFIGRKILVDECLEQQLASQWRWLSGKEFACQCWRRRRCGFYSRVGKIPWRRAWQPTAVFLPGDFHGQRSLVGYSLKKLGMTEWLSTRHTQMHTQHVSRVRPCLSSHRCWSLQCFCLHDKKSLWRICVSATEVENEKKKLRKEISIL